MTRPHADRVKAIWTGTGTGTMTLGGAWPGEPVQALPAALDGQVLRYLIKHETAAEAEAGYGLYTHAGTTLSRIYRTYPTLGGSAVSFSAGNKSVSLTNVHLDLVPNLATTDPGPTNDINSGFLEGMDWINTTTNQAFICTQHSAGTAVWGRQDNITLDQNDIMARLVAGNGQPIGVAAVDLTDHTSPVTGDFILAWTAAGLLRKINVGNMPSLSPTKVPSDASTFSLASTLRMHRNVILTSHQASVVFEVPQAAGVGDEWRIMPVHDGCTVTINGGVGTLSPNPARMINGGLVIVTVTANPGSAPVVEVRGEVIVPAVTVSTKTYDADDHGQVFEATGTQTFGATTGFPSGFVTEIWNASGSSITIDGLDNDHTLIANNVARVRKRASGALICTSSSGATVLDAA